MAALGRVRCSPVFVDACPVMLVGEIGGNRSGKMLEMFLDAPHGRDFTLVAGFARHSGLR